MFQLQTWITWWWWIAVWWSEEVWIWWVWAQTCSKLDSWGAMMWVDAAGLSFRKHYFLIKHVTIGVNVSFLGNFQWCLIATGSNSDWLFMTQSKYRIWSNTSRGYNAKFEIEGGLLLLLKSSLIEIAEFCWCDFNWEQREAINGQSHLSYDVTC